MKFIVKEDDTRKRLDKFLTEKLSDSTRSQIKKLIKSSSVLINQKPAKVHHFLKDGDKISIVTRGKRQETSKLIITCHLTACST